MLFNISVLELTHFFFPSAVNGDISSSYPPFGIVIEIINKYKYIYLLPSSHFIRIKFLNPYKLMNLVIVSPNLREFSKYLKNSPGLLPPIFFHPLQLLFCRIYALQLFFFFISQVLFAEVNKNVIMTLSFLQSNLSSRNIYISLQKDLLLQNFLVSIFIWAFLKV